MLTSVSRHVLQQQEFVASATWSVPFCRHAELAPLTSSADVCPLLCRRALRLTSIDTTAPVCTDGDQPPDRATHCLPVPKRNHSTDKMPPWKTFADSENNIGRVFSAPTAVTFGHRNLTAGLRVLSVYVLDRRLGRVSYVISHLRLVPFINRERVRSTLVWRCPWVQL